MEDILRSCVESRKTAIYSTYNGNDSNILKIIDDYFKKLEEFAKECSDVGDFENKFATSPLAKEYTDLFTKIMKDDNQESFAKTLAKDLGEEIVDDITHEARVKANQEAFDKVRDIPGVGKIVEVKQHFDLFNKFRKKKND